MGLTSLFSGYTNLLTSTNLKLATHARNTAEAGINEALYRLSRQEGQPGALTPNLNDPNWQVEIAFTSGDGNASDGVVSTIQAAADWPEQRPAHPVTLRFKKPDSTQPSAVLFYDRSQTPPFRTITLPSVTIPNTAFPVIQILATGRDYRGAERRLLAEVRAATAFAPPAPISSGVDVDLNGSGFLDGVNHDHRIVISSATIYGDTGSETTDSHGGSVSKDSPDDNKDDTNDPPRTCGLNGNNGVANPDLTYPPPNPRDSPARLFNMQVSVTDPTPAWVGLSWIAPCWHGTNSGATSALAFSNGPIVTRYNKPTSNVWTKGVFTWGRNSQVDLGPTGTDCSLGYLVCRPAVLTHGPDSFSASSHFPYFQEYLGLDDKSFQDLLNRPDTIRADLDAGRPPLGFTYIQGNYTFNNSTASPGTNDFGLLYVTGDLTINGNQIFKGLIFIDGSLKVGGSPVILGAVMVRGSTHITVGTGNMKLVYSKRAAELGVQTAHAWQILTWEDTAIQGEAYP
jgi:hypothetical protein